MPKANILVTPFFYSLNIGRDLFSEFRLYELKWKYKTVKVDATILDNVFHAVESVIGSYV